MFSILAMPCWVSHDWISMNSVEEARGTRPRMISPQMSVLFPFAGTQYNREWKKPNPWWNMFQIILPLGVFSTCRFLEETPLKYFSLRSWLTLWFEYIFERNFLSNTRLADPGSLIYNPPSIIGCLTISQLTKWNFILLPLPPLHIKSLINLDIWSMINFGAKRKEAWLT